jgi:hypothetical protein
MQAVIGVVNETGCPSGLGGNIENDEHYDRPPDDLPEHLITSRASHCRRRLAVVPPLFPSIAQGNPPTNGVDPQTYLSGSPEDLRCPTPVAPGCPSSVPVRSGLALFATIGARAVRICHSRFGPVTAGCSARSQPGITR